MSSIAQRICLFHNKQNHDYVGTFIYLLNLAK